MTTTRKTYKKPRHKPKGPSLAVRSAYMWCAW